MPSVTTSPTFLNLMLISGAWQEHDLSSLQLIAYGTESMPAEVLKRLGEAFPGVRLLQTYGLSEMGVLRTRSRDSGPKLNTGLDESSGIPMRVGPRSISSDPSYSLRASR